MADYRSMRRWNSPGDEWHTHSETHVHPGGSEPHPHIFVTDQETYDKLYNLLERLTLRGQIPQDSQDACDLWHLMVKPDGDTDTGARKPMPASIESTD